jgi:hypothetical protein
MLVQLLLPALAAPVAAPLGSDHQLLSAGLQDPHHLEKEKKMKRKNSFAVRAVDSWNQLPESVRAEGKLSHFKRKLKGLAA